jgi:ketosteroid isomerase-like protein
MSNRRKEIVEEVNAAFGSSSVEGVLAHCVDDVTWTMVGDRTVNGKDAIRRWMASLNFDGPRFTIERTIAEGDFVSSHGDVTMKDKDGTPTLYGFCDVYRFKGDKIAEMKSFVVRTGQA